MQEESEKMQRERERFEREVEDIARDLGAQFEHAMNDIVRSELEPLFVQMRSRLENALSVANEQDQAIRSTMMAVQELLASLQSA